MVSCWNFNFEFRNGVCFLRVVNYRRVPVLAYSMYCRNILGIYMYVKKNSTRGGGGVSCIHIYIYILGGWRHRLQHTVRYLPSKARSMLAIDSATAVSGDVPHSEWSKMASTKPTRNACHKTNNRQDTKKKKLFEGGWAIEISMGYKQRNQYSSSGEECSHDSNQVFACDF